MSIITYSIAGNPQLFRCVVVIGARIKLICGFEGNASLLKIRKYLTCNAKLYIRQFNQNGYHTNYVITVITCIPM